MGTLRGTPRLSGAGSALCTADTGAGTDTGLASAPRGRARKSQGSIVPQDKGGQQPWDLLGGAALQQQPAERWVTCTSRLCFCVYRVPSLPCPSFPGQTGVYQPGYCFAPAAGLFGGNKRELFLLPRGVLASRALTLSSRRGAMG